MTPTHTAAAREALGPGPFIAPEVKILLDSNRSRALDTARAHLRQYLGLENYANNLLRIGYTADDLVDGGVSG